MDTGGLTAWAAAWFLLAAVPISLFVMYSDLRSMKIPNIAVYTLVIAYAVLGLIALPFGVYLWHWTHLIVALAVGIILNMGGVMGAGDAKFIAAAAPMLSTNDLPLLIPVFAACLLAGVVTHRIAKHTPLRRIAPDWESWTAGNRFPMGFPLGMTLILYLSIVVYTR